jgi:carbonic anhydrase
MVGYNLKQAGTINNNGHTLGFGFSSGSTPYIMGGRLPAGDRFDFLQLHWHWGSDSSKGSEHTMNGKEYPIEVHLVHVNTKYYVDGAPSQGNFDNADGLAVLGIFYEISTEDNANLTNIVSKVNEVAVEQRRRRKQGRQANLVDLDMTLALESFLPADTTQYYYYQGGLTTPSCNEAVLWTNMKSTQTISEAQLEVFRSMMDSDGITLNNNYRPPQPLNNRTIYTTGTSTTAGSSNMFTELLNTAFTAAVVTGLVGIVAPLFAPPPSQQRSDAASTRAEQALRAGRDQWGTYWG